MSALNCGNAAGGTWAETPNGRPAPLSLSIAEICRSSAALQAERLQQAHRPHGRRHARAIIDSSLRQIPGVQMP